MRRSDKRDYDGNIEQMRRAEYRGVIVAGFNVQSLAVRFFVHEFAQAAFRSMQKGRLRIDGD